MKTLILSHNCISNNNNMGKAMLSIVEAFKKNELCQLYIYPSIPDVSICGSYYRITDKEILKKYVTKKKCGREILDNEINDSNILFENEKDKKYYRKKKGILKKIARNFIWQKVDFLDDNLKKWLKKEAPTHILCFPGDYCFFYDLIIEISEYLEIPIITYVMDDYYNLKVKGFLEKIYYKKLNNSIMTLINKSECVITICDEMTKFYKDTFENKNIVTIMLGSNVIIKNSELSKNNVNVLSYIGNIANNRYKNLIDIGKMIDIINENNNLNIRLNIYSDIQNKKILSDFGKIKSISYCGFVKGTQYLKAIENSDMLIHVESFEEKDIDLVKHSVSTKISQSLSSGKCLLAYGPINVASIGYLNRTNSAFIIDEKSKLLSSLVQIFSDYKLRKKIIKNGFEALSNYQDNSKNSKKIYYILHNIEKR